MNTFTRVMAETAVNNQQDINNMIHQTNELSQRMNKRQDILKVLLLR